MSLKKFDLLYRHHFIAKTQSVFFQSTKEALPNDTVIILLDFTENYSFFTPKCSPRLSLGKQPGNTAPILLLLQRKKILKCLSLCIISDCMRHDTKTVHTFTCKVISYIKESFHAITKVLYFSDGAAI